MASWACVECTTTYSVGAPRCPHCGSTKHTKEGAMPKITVHGGPTVAGASVVGGSWSNEGEPDVWPEPEQADETPAEEGGEESSPGSSSSASDEKPSSEPETKPASRRKPARTTGSRSTKGRTGSSSAPSTDGGQGAGTSAADGEGSSS